MFPLHVPKAFKIIAHRGASAYAPENTMASFLLAWRMGAKEVELDVQLSSDGVPVVCHDGDLKRYGHGPIAVESLSSKELLALDMGSWLSPFHFKLERMISFASLLDAFGSRFVYHVEIKGSASGLVERTLEEVRARRLMGSCCFTSFSKEMLRQLRRVAPDAKCGWLVENLNDEVFAVAKELGLQQLCPNVGKLDSESARKAFAHAKELRGWGMSGDPIKFESQIKLAVECSLCGATVNNPDWLTHEA